MAPKVGLTAVVLTKNEEENLTRCLKLIAWVDKIVVIADGSTGETVKIAKKAGAKIYQRPLDNYCSQRNFALEKVETPWVLFIDPDEEVTLELATEIQEVIKKKEFDGYRFPRKNIIFGKWITHSGWYPDFQLHLFKRDRGKYVEKVHEQVVVDGKIGELKAHLIHNNYPTIASYLEKLVRYTSLEAENQIESGYKFAWQDLIKKPLSEFLRRFFAEEGFKDGIHGLALALLQAFSELIVYLKIWEKEGFKEESIDDFSDLAEKSIKDFYFWQAKTAKDPVKKILSKIKSKV